MADLVLTEDPEVGAGSAPLIVAELPTIRSNVDTYADQGQPAKNFGDRAKLTLNGGAGSDNCLGFIHYARPFPLGSSIAAATLYVYRAGAWAGSTTLTAKRIIEPWKEGRLTWNRQPAVDALHAAVEALSAGGDDEVAIDVTDIIADVAAGSPFYGFRIESNTNANRRLWSSETPTGRLRPVLVIDWDEPPLAPTELAPSGGRSISLDRPRLRWRYRDPEDDAQSASRVQVWADEAMSGSPLYDSTKTTNPDPEWDLDDHAPGPFSIADGDTVYWRVMVWDAADAVSPWSDLVSFQRNTKGVLTIVNPLPEPDNVVVELTPPLDWTMTGRTQVRATAELYELATDETPRRLIDRWHLADETSVTPAPPNGAGNQPEGLHSGGTFRFVVKAWDDFDRVPIAGDPDYLIASQDFTYERDGTPDPVDSLTATQVVTAEGIRSPTILLEWADSSEPDHYCIRVNGTELIAHLDPEDLLVSPGQYAYPYSRAVGDEAVTFEVERVVVSTTKARHSDGNPTATITIHVGGVWLVDDDPAEPLATVFADRTQSQLEVGESGTTYDRPNARRPLRLVSSIRGYEGSIGGILLNATYRDAFLTLRGRVGKTFRLAQHDLNIPVELEAISSASPRPAGKGRWDGAVNVYQVGEWPMDVDGD